jgi:methylmalonyl-CoA mutase N-terminal domain/subunit
VDAAIAELVRAAVDPTANVMGPTIAAVKANASMGEIVTALESIFGRYREVPVF